MSHVDVEIAREQWARGDRDLRAAVADPLRHARLTSQASAVTAALRKRVGGNFTLARLADEYAAADRWVWEVVAELEEDRPGWSASVSTAADAAFHAYARGARDFEP